MSEPALFREDLFAPEPKARDPYSPIQRIPLNSAPYMWVGRGYSRDEQGYTKFVYERTRGKDFFPEYVATAGTPENTVRLQPACRKVARAARMTDPAVSLDWQYVADWLDMGCPLSLIVETIEKQVARWKEYNGCFTLKAFDASVRSAWDIERNRK